MTPTKNLSETKQWLHTAKTLTEALPFMRRYAGKTFVVKYGGHAMGDKDLAQIFAHDIVLLKQVGIHPIVVHGGGPQIGRMLEALAVESSFVDGLRVTDEKSVEVVEMVLSGSINKAIVSAINAAGGKAIGLSGKDCSLIEAERLRHRQKDPSSHIEQILDLGFVGEPVRVNPFVLGALEQAGMIPVIAPIGIGSGGETYNINADTVAGAVAAAVGAARLLLLTDVSGVKDSAGEVIAELGLAEARALIANGVAREGMIPKLTTALAAVEGGVDAVAIIDGRVPHGMLLEIFTDRGFGTLLRQKAEDKMQDRGPTTPGAGDA